jgi:hypothetical protein
MPTQAAATPMKKIDSMGVSFRVNVKSVVGWVQDACH